MTMIRLDKYLSDAGIGTRSEIKKYIKKGFVSINGVTAQKSDIKISLDSDQISFHNETISLSEYEYFILNKPAGYVSATKDNTAPTVLSLIDSNRKDLFPVGRLDKDTEGLLLITNNGELAHKLLSPKKHVNKIYYAVVEGIVTPEDIVLFQNGLKIGDEDLNVAMPATLLIEKIDVIANQSQVKVTIQEGKFHQIKRMFRSVGKKVIYLQRIGFGPLYLPENLELGTHRPLTVDEVELLQNL